MNGKGKPAEDFAAEYLSEKGNRILERNFRCRFGEIDIIFTDGQYLVFCEVKARGRNSIAPGRESVNYTKISRIRKTALWYISGHKTEAQPRFDVLELRETEGCFFVTAHITNAF